MNGIGETVRSAARYAGSAMLFALTACYIFVSLGLLSLGIVTFPSVMLGRLGFLTVVTDLSENVLLIGSAGVLLTGVGMSLCIIPVCAGAYRVLENMIKRAEIRRKRMRYEEDKAS